MSDTVAIQSRTKVKSTQKTYTLLEYLTREERTVHKHEYYNGNLRRMPGAKFNHNLIATNVLMLLSEAVRKLEKEYYVINSDQKVLVESENVVLYPDALVIFEKPQFWKGRTDLVLNPLVIVEVASKSTRKYDWGGKFLLYQQIPSFREYVIIHQEKIAVHTWFKKDATTWKTAESKDLNGSVPLQALGLELPLSRVYNRVEFK